MFGTDSTSFRVATAAFILLLVGASMACGGDDSTTDAGSDTGSPADTGTPSDTGTPTDTGTPSDTGTPTDAGSVACGEMTCGPNEFCFIECTCCGIPDAGPPSADYTCMPIPDGCDGTNLCECELGLSCGQCTGPREVQCPCA